MQVGIPALVLEREPEPRQEGAAITFWPNAFRVLDVLGVADLLRKTHPMLTRHAQHSGVVKEVFLDAALLYLYIQKDAARRGYSGSHLLTWGLT